MKFRIQWLALPLACLSVMPAASAASSHLTSADSDAVIASARDATAKSLKIDAHRLHLAPEQIKRQSDWVFLTAQLQDAAGKRFDYAGTDQHEAAQAGGISSLVAALLRREGSGWKLVELAVGPTDVAWQGWAAAHKAPAQLFQ